MSETPRGNRAVFRLPDFRHYNLARFCWTNGLQMMGVATAWYVYEKTQDTLALGFIGLSSLLPALLLSLVTGPAADRYDRRKILLVSCSIMAVCALVTLALVLQGVVWPIYILLVVLGIGRAFSNPAGQSLLMDIVPDEESASGLAWNNSINQTAAIMGPALGGLLYPFGAGVPFVVAFLLFVIAIAAIWAIRQRSAVKHRPPVTLAMLVGGYRYMWKTPVILGTISLDLAAVLLGGATSLLPAFAQDVFHAGPWALGALRAAPAIGSVVASVTVAHFPLRRRVGMVMFGCVFVFGLATIGFGLSTNIFVAMFFLSILGAADIVSVVIRQTFIQIETPPEMRGRVNAVHAISTNTSNQLGDFESGVVAHFIGPVNAVLVGGLGSLVATIVWMKLFPELRTRDTFMRPAPPASAEPSRSASAPA
jgi:MFS family permease